MSKFKTRGFNDDYASCVLPTYCHDAVKHIFKDLKNDVVDNNVFNFNANDINANRFDVFNYENLNNDGNLLFTKDTPVHIDRFILNNDLTVRSVRNNVFNNDIVNNIVFSSDNRDNTELSVLNGKKVFNSKKKGMSRKPKDARAARSAEGCHRVSGDLTVM